MSNLRKISIFLSVIAFGVAIWVNNYTNNIHFRSSIIEEKSSPIKSVIPIPGSIGKGHRCQITNDNFSFYIMGTPSFKLGDSLNIRTVKGEVVMIQSLNGDWHYIIK